jgi:tRNA (adenine22-N1)-methyltransferase
MSARLEAIVELAERGDILCDVGCDHAHVPIRLLQSGCYRRAIGMDVIAGPLGKAAGNLSLYGMEDLVELRLSNGLDAFSAGEADTLVVTGMGGTLMEEILLRYPDRTGSFRALVLGPQSDPDKVRAALRRLGAKIIDERLIYEDGKYYPVLRAVFHSDSGSLADDPEAAHTQEAHAQAAFGSGQTDTTVCPPDMPAMLRQEADIAFSPDTPAGLRQEAEDLFGPVLLRERDDMLKSYLLWQKGVNDRILHSLKRANDSNNEALTEKRNQVTRKDKLIKAALSVF